MSGREKARMRAELRGVPGESEERPVRPREDAAYGQRGETLRGERPPLPGRPYARARKS